MSSNVSVVKYKSGIIQEDLLKNYLYSSDSTIQLENVNTTGDILCQGDIQCENLVVNQNLTSVNQLAVDDNIIVLNNGVTGTPTLDAGIEVERGSSNNQLLFFNETTDTWQTAERDGGDLINKYDVLTSNSSLDVSHIADNSITFSKTQQISNNVLLGNNNGSTANIEELGASDVKTMLSLNNVENTALSTWAGTSNITTVGTIANGSWGGSTIPTNKGGTNLTSFTDKGVLYASSTSALSQVASNSTATKKYLQTVNGGTPSYEQVNFSDLTGNTAIGYDIIPSANFKALGSTSYKWDAYTYFLDTVVMQMTSAITSDRVFDIYSTITSNNTANGVTPFDIRPNIIISSGNTAQSFTNFYLRPTINTGVTVRSIDNLYNLYAMCTASGGSATFTNAYNGYFTAPTLGGTSNTALYSANLSVGYAGITPPTNGAIISGNLGVGVNTTSSKLEVNGTSTLKNILSKDADSYDIGASGSYFNNSYMNNTHMNNLYGKTGSTINLNGHIIPASNNTYTLGSSTYRMSMVNTNALNVYSSSVSGTAVYFSGTNTGNFHTLATPIVTSLTGNQQLRSFVFTPNMIFDNANTFTTDMLNMNIGGSLNKGSSGTTLTAFKQLGIVQPTTSGSRVINYMYGAHIDALTAGASGNCSLFASNFLIGNDNRNVPAKSGLISGSLGIGGASDTIDARLHIKNDHSDASTKKDTMLYIHGTHTGTTVLSTYNTLSYVGSSPIFGGIYTNCIFDLNGFSGTTAYNSRFSSQLQRDGFGTITNFYNANFSVADISGLRTITNCYNVYISNAAGGTNNTALFTTNAVVGSYAGTQPPSNGMIISGNVGIGSNNPTSKLVVVGSSSMQNIIPSTTDTYTLGSSPSNFYNAGYINTITTDQLIGKSGGTVNLNAHIVATADNTRDIGSSSYYFKDSYINTSTVNQINGKTSSTINTGGHLVPTTDKTYDIGSTSKYYTNIYSSNITLNSTQGIDKSTVYIDGDYKTTSTTTSTGFYSSQNFDLSLLGSNPTHLYGHKFVSSATDDRSPTSVTTLHVYKPDATTATYKAALYASNGVFGSSNESVQNPGDGEIISNKITTTTAKLDNITYNTSLNTNQCFDASNINNKAFKFPQHTAAPITPTADDDNCVYYNTSNNNLMRYNHATTSWKVGISSRRITFFGINSHTFGETETSLSNGIYTYRLALPLAVTIINNIGTALCTTETGNYTHIKLANVSGLNTSLNPLLFKMQCRGYQYGIDKWIKFSVVQTNGSQYTGSQLTGDAIASYNPEWNFTEGSTNGMYDFQFMVTSYAADDVFSICAMVYDNSGNFHASAFYGSVELIM